MTTEVGGRDNGHRVLIEATLDGPPPATLQVRADGAVVDQATGRTIGQAAHPYRDCGDTSPTIHLRGLDRVAGKRCIRPSNHTERPVTEADPHRAADGAKWWPV